MATRSRINQFIRPMLTTAVDKPFDSDDWIFELKLDGYRAIAEIRSSQLKLYSRNGISFKERYPIISQALKKIRSLMILDGEIVLLNEEGEPDFQKLQNYEENPGYALAYYVFDILSLKGKDLKNLPLIERKAILKKTLGISPVIRFCDHIEKSGKQFYKKVIKKKLEGIIAKRKESIYLPGFRTKEWLKIKDQKSQEAIIAGFTAPKGSRRYFGSLLLSQYNNDQLEYIGSAGTGFSDKLLKELMQKMKPLITTRSPFNDKVKANGSITWIKPVLVCEVGYSEITTGGMLRHPVYKKLRTEKKAKNINKKTELPVAVKKIIKKIN